MIVAIVVSAAGLCASVLFGARMVADAARAPVPPPAYQPAPEVPSSDERFEDWNPVPLGHDRRG